MKIDRQTSTTTAEEVGAKKADRIAPSWRVRVSEFWPEDVKEDVGLVPDYDKGLIAVVRDDAWAGSVLERSISELDADLERAGETVEGNRFSRLRAAALFRGHPENGRLAIPKEVVWLLQRDNEQERDVTIVPVGPTLELWPTRRWQNYLAGHLFEGLD